MHAFGVVKLMLNCKTGLHEFGVGKAFILIFFSLMVTGCMLLLLYTIFFAKTNDKYIF